MKVIRIFLLIILVMLISFSPTSADAETLYIQETTGYYNVDGEILRFEQRRDFSIEDYEFYEIQEDQETVQYVNITMLDRNTNGIPETVIQAMKRSNFEPILFFNDDNSLRKVEWIVNLFRAPVDASGSPFDDAGLFTSGTLGHETYDRVIEINKFSSSLEYFEYQIINGNLVKLWVNTEISTDNHDDGRIYNTAIHIIKRDQNQEILFNYAFTINEANSAQRIFNRFDMHDTQLVPFKLGLVFLVIYAYIRITKYWRENNFQIIRGAKEENAKTESEEPRS